MVQLKSDTFAELLLMYDNEMDTHFLSKAVRGTKLMRTSNCSGNNKREES